MSDQNNFEVIIIGGSYAGLSAAMSLGRSLRKVLVIDSGKPCNQQTPHSHNFLTQDGKTPLEIATIAKEQVAQYKTVVFKNDLAVSAIKNKEIFEVNTQSGSLYTAKKLIIATGIKDSMPDIKGFSACWGISVIHCPYCHGFEYKNQKTAIFADNEKAMHLAPLINNLTPHLFVLTSGPNQFSPEQMEKLTSHKIGIIEDKIIEFEHENGQLKCVIFNSGKKESFDAVYAGLGFEQQTSLLVDLGCELNEHGYIRTDHFQKTSVEGVFACGDNCSMMRSVANAVAQGNLTGAMVNKELCES